MSNSYCAQNYNNFQCSKLIPNSRDLILPGTQLNNHVTSFANGNNQSGSSVVNNNNPFLMRSMPSLLNPMLIMNLIRSGNLGAFSWLMSNASQYNTLKNEPGTNMAQMMDSTNDSYKNKVFSSDEHSNDSISAELEENEESVMYDLYKQEKGKTSDNEDLDQEEDSLGKFKSESSPMEMFPRLKSESSSDEENSDHRPRNLDNSRTSGSDSNVDNYCSRSNIYSSSSPSAFSFSSSSSSSSCTPFNNPFRKHSSPKLPTQTFPTANCHRKNEKKINFAIISTLID